MRKHLNDYLFSPLAWLLTIFLIILLVLVLLFLTPFGVKIIASTADSSLKELTIRGVSGSLLSGLHIDEIIWDDGDSIALEDVDLKLQHYNTDRGRLVAEKITAGRLTINVSSNSSGEDIVSLPDFGLPLNINAHLIELDSLRITQNVADDPESQTLLFQVKNIQLKKVTINDGYLRFRRLQGNPIIMDEPLKINVTEGKLNMNQPHDIKTGGSISFKHPKIGDIGGEIQLDGTLTDYRFEGEIEHQQEKLGLQTIKLLGQGNYKRVHLEQVSLNGDHGTVEAKGRIVWDPEVSWAFIVDGKELSTKKFLAEWPATINTSFRYSGSYIDSRLENNINIVSLDGILREYKLKLQGQVKEREGVVTTENLELQLGDNHLQVEGKMNQPFNLKWNVDAQDIKQMLPKNLVDLQLTGSIKGSGELRGTTKKPAVKIKIAADGLGYQKYKQGKETLYLEGDLRLENDVLQLNKLTVKSGANTLQVTGQASEPFKLKWNINAKNLKQLMPDLAGQIKGEGALNGTIEKPEVKVKLAVNGIAYQGFKQGKAPLFLEGELGLNKKVIQLKDLLVRSGVNTVKVSGQASEPLNLQVKINAENLAETSPDIGGRLVGDAQILGLYQSPVLKTNLVASNLRYKEILLGKSDLRVSGEVQLVDGVPMVKELLTQVGSNRLQISGRASSPFNLNWNIDGKNLKQLMPALSGHLVAKGQLQGSIDKPVINAIIDAKNIRYKDFKLASANITAKTSDGIYRIKGDLKKLQSAGQKISKAKLELNGRIENHTIIASIDHQEAKVSLKANGGWLNQSWKGNVQSLLLRETQAGDWRLQKPTQITLSKNSVSSTKFCLSNKKTQACSTLGWSDIAGLKAKGTLQKTPLSLFKPWLPEGLSLNGTVSGSYDIKQNNGKPKGKVKFTLPDSNFSFTGEDGEEQVFGYKDAELIATVDNRTVKAKIGMNIVNRGKFSSTVKIKLSPESGRHTINGNAQFDIPNINWAQDFIPHSRGLRGALTSKVTFTGLLSKPKIVGTASLKKGYLRLPEAGTELTNINIDLRADKPNHAVLNGKMFMGKGLLNITGSLDIKDIANWKAKVKLKGKNIRFMNTNEIRAIMSPDLTIDITPKVVSLTGKIVIPQADIHLKDIPETSIDESGDAFVVGERKPGEQVSAIRFKPNVQVELGNKVKLNAFGLKAKLSGSVHVSHNRRDILANGSLRVTDGKFQAYGQSLEINNGRLIFNGSPKLVGMDIRATRKVDDTIVGVHLGGNVLKPKSTIFSDPTLPESEALSFLLTGHSLSTSSGRESALLMSAVRGLGITGSGSLIHNIGASLGLDDVNIVSGEDLKQSELALGKRLGSRLYVRYLVGLFDQTQKIAIEYKINKMLSLEAQTTADDYGLDFIYEIERD